MTCRVACCQVPLAIGDASANRATVRAAIERAAADGAQVVVLPELASSGYVFADRAELEALAEDRDGPTITEWAELAASLDVVIVGGFAERSGGMVYNSAAALDSSGLLGVYRKAHLWDAENAVFDRGDDLPLVVDTAQGRLGVMICYDVEFPEWVRAAALSGVDLLCVPVNWPLLPRPDGERPTEQYRVLAGAGMNRLAIAVCDRTAVEREQDWIGGSIITDADGYPVAVAQYREPAVVIADVDLTQSRIKRVNAHNDVFGDRRVDLYRRTALLD